MTPKRYATVREAIVERKTNLLLLCVRLCVRPQIAGLPTARFARRVPGTVAYVVIDDPFQPA